MQVDIDEAEGGETVVPEGHVQDPLTAMKVGLQIWQKLVPLHVWQLSTWQEMHKLLAVLRVKR